MAWKPKVYKRLESKGNGMQKAHLQGSKKGHLLPAILPSRLIVTDCVCVSVCVLVYACSLYVPGGVAFRLKVVPVKI